MNTSHSQQKGFAHVLVIIIVVVILAALGWVAWKQLSKKTDQPSNSPAAVVNGTKSDQRHENTLTDPNAFASKKRTLSLTTPLKTEGKGDCTLTMKNGAGKVVLTKQGSNKDNTDGCEKWMLEVGKLPAGKYTATVVYTAGNKKSQASLPVTLK